MTGADLFVLYIAQLPPDLWLQHDKLPLISAGVLFDCHEYGGAISSQVNLQQLGGMQLAGLWSCIYDAMRYSKDVNTVPNQVSLHHTFVALTRQHMDDTLLQQLLWVT